MFPALPYLPWLLAALVVPLLVWLAWRRPNRQRLVSRIVASVVAGISLVLLVFPPVTEQAINPSAAILLTPGYNPDTLEALLAKQEAKPIVYTLGADADKSTPLTNLYTLRQQQPGLQTLHLLGYGLEEQQLKALEGVQLIPHLSEAPEGVSAVQWPQKVRLGEAVTVTGKYKSKGNNSWLYLNAAGQLRDSIKLSPDTTQSFSLSYTPKQTDRYVYTLLAKTGEQSDTLGQVPVQVTEQQQLRVLLLASAPSFEFRFLKNHLGEQQHEVAYRTTISKDISQSEWVNMPKADLSRITARLLQNFDVVITEPQALQSMSAGERATLQRAVTEDGLGVLTIATEPATNRSTSFFTNFKSRRVSQQNTRNIIASWTGSTPAAATAAPYALINTTTVNNLVEVKGKSSVAGVKRAGWGKVAISFIPQTFPWLLGGKDEIYASYWTNLLTEVAKEQLLEKFWAVEQPQAPQPDLPVVLTFTDYTSNGAPSVPGATVIGLPDSVSVNLPLARNIYQPEKYSATFWPRSSGWYQVNTTDAEPYYFYVHDAAEWPFAEIQARLQTTRQFTANQGTSTSEGKIAYKEEPVPLIWFFVLFALSSSFLWLEEKF